MVGMCDWLLIEKSVAAWILKERRASADELVAQTPCASGVCVTHERREVDATHRVRRAVAQELCLVGHVALAANWSVEWKTVD
jgi:hypothetical protein